MAVLERSTDSVPAATQATTKGRVLWKWVVTTDHKVIGNLYFVTSTAFFSWQS